MKQSGEPHVLGPQLVWPCPAPSVVGRRGGTRLLGKRSRVATKLAHAILTHTPPASISASTGDRRSASRCTPLAPAGQRSAQCAELKARAFRYSRKIRSSIGLAPECGRRAARCCPRERTRTGRVRHPIRIASFIMETRVQHPRREGAIGWVSTAVYSGNPIAVIPGGSSPGRWVGLFETALSWDLRQ